jgi:hypothetical protein
MPSLRSGLRDYTTEGPQMQTPNVTEFPRHLEPVAYDTFLGGSPSRFGQAQPTRNLRSEAKTPPLSRDLNDARCREFERAGVLHRLGRHCGSAARLRRRFSFGRSPEMSTCCGYGGATLTELEG